MEKEFKNMKVSVITRHAITNYGSLLQAIATQKAIESLGHACEIINYIRNEESYLQLEKTLLAQKPEWNSNPIKKAIYLALRQPESVYAGRKFEKAQKQYLNLTKRYETHEQLTEDKPDADVYMTGSDQVWGPTGNGTYDSSYCLSFASESDKKVAYAASFGRTNITSEIIDYYKKWLGRYDNISVREDSAVELLNKIGIAAAKVIDPTLLLDKTFWSKYTKPIKHKNYILVYQLHNDKRVGRYAAETAKAFGLPLIRVSASLHQISREGKFIWCPEIGEFLSYIKNAKCMITDSFHGTAFAINFNTPFVEVLPNNGTGTRNISILKMTGLSERILKNDNDIELAQKKINFSSVNEILKKERIYSLQMLKQMIES